MKVIKIKGGLGNQLFQYAYGIKLLLVDNEKVLFDTSAFAQENNTRDTSRPFLLDKFNIDKRAAFGALRQTIFGKIKDKVLLRISKDYMFYQNEKYFAPIKDTIKEQFTLKKPFSAKAQNISNNINLQNMPVSLHIRRGDYANDEKTRKHHGLCSIEYYQAAVEYIKKQAGNPIFFVFSDDIAWAKQNLKLDNAIFVSHPDIHDYEELMLMSQCKHNIIANSTFSWWGAYLNKNEGKIVIAPKQWNAKSTSATLNILPTSWIQI